MSLLKAFVALHNDTKGTDKSNLRPLMPGLPKWDGLKKAPQRALISCLTLK